MQDTLRDVMERLRSVPPSEGEPLPPVRSTLRLHAHPSLEWHVIRGCARDALGELYTLELECFVRDSFVELREVLGTRVTLELERADLSRVFHGVLVSAEHVGSRVHGEGGVETVLRLHVAPALWMLSRRQTSRVFHHATALEIVRTVLRSAGLYAGDELDVRVGDLEGAQIRPREYCVQYQETDLDFVRRLLEEEGLTLYFEHPAGASAERLVIVDGAQPRHTAYRQVDNGAGRSTVELADPEHHVLHPRQVLVAFGAVHEVRSDVLVTRDHDFSNTRRYDAMTASRTAGPGSHEVYEYPGRYVFDPLDRVHQAGPIGHAAYPEAPRSEHHTGERAALVRSEELRRDAEVLVGRGNVMGFDAGALFDLTGHLQGDYDREYLVTEVRHELWAPDDPRNARMDPDERASGYANELRALPSSTVFRPARVTPRPRIQGAQTAVVVGHAGQEILTDWYGRVKVQFPWDRESQAHRNAELAPGEREATNPDHLCWVRVAQGWAGAGWGSMFVPRVGMEVVVVFLDGDPDRPLAVGCVYNDASPPPYPLPNDGHVSTIRTRSTPVSPGEERYNELRFDDTAGAEQLYFRAQRDLDEQVGRNHTTEVGEDHEVRVARDERHTVGGQQRAGVGGDQDVSVGGGQRLHVGGDRAVHVEGAQTQTVVGPSHRVCTSDETIMVLGTRTTEIRGGDHVVSSGPTSTLIRPNEPEDVDPDGEQVEAEYLESRTVMGSRYQQVDALDEHWAHEARAVVEDSEKRTIGKRYTLNVGEEANLLITGLDDPDDESLGYFMDKKAIRIGTQARSVEEVVMFRGQDVLALGEHAVIAQADAKPLELRIGGTGCVIRLSADGKKIELVGLEEIVLKGGESSITIGKDIRIDAGEGTVTLSGSKVHA